MPSSYRRSLSVSSAHFCLSLPLVIFQLPFIASLFMVHLPYLGSLQIKRSYGNLLTASRHWLYFRQFRLASSIDTCGPTASAISRTHHHLSAILIVVYRRIRTDLIHERLQFILEPLQLMKFLNA